MRSKRLCITGVSAMQAWDEGAMSYARPSRVTSPNTLADTSAELAAFTTLPQGCTEPVHIAVGNDAHRLRTKQWAAHRRRASYPVGSLLDIDDNRLVVSPNEFFLHRAPKLSIVQAVLLGMELCGYYSTLMSVPYKRYCDALIRDRSIRLGDRPWPPANWDLSLEHQRNLMDNGFVTREPLSTVDAVNRYLAHVLSPTSHSMAKSAARVIRGNSHSPMESRLYARYCLPRRFGGLNLNPVRLHEEIPLTDNYARSLGIDRYWVDLYWPTCGVAIEYEGEYPHSSLTAQQRDRLRRNVLQATGIRIISIDKAQFANESIMELHGVEIAKALGLAASTLEPRSSEKQARDALINEIHDWDFDLYR